MHPHLTLIAAQQHIADLHKSRRPQPPRAHRHQQPRRPRTPPRRHAATASVLSLRWLRRRPA